MVLVEPPPANNVSHLPSGMVPFDGVRFERSYRYRSRECGLYDGAPFVGFAGNSPPGLHSVVEGREIVEVRPFAIDRLPVSNARFQEFLRTTAYSPGSREFFLAHWRDGVPAPGTEADPVTFVDLDDARAFAAWAGGRLPTEAEWQLAAEAGVLEYGNRRVWNWTESERSDGHTRFCILKGGASFEATGSAWYADGGPREPQWSAKYLLQWSGQDRAATIGFRCAVPLAG
jgi:formylglycine-generating enzyme required for sulfatase activity